MNSINQRIESLETSGSVVCPACGAGGEIQLAPLSLDNQEKPPRERCPMCGRKQIVLGPIEFARADELHEKSGGNWNLESLSTSELRELRDMSEDTQ